METKCSQVVEIQHPHYERSSAAETKLLIHTLQLLMTRGDIEAEARVALSGTKMLWWKIKNRHVPVSPAMWSRTWHTTGGRRRESQNKLSNTRVFIKLTRWRMKNVNQEENNIK